MNETLILLISNGITALAGWFIGRRRQQADTDNQVLKNLEIESLNIKVQELEKKIDELHNENRKLKSKINL